MTTPSAPRESSHNNPTSTIEESKASEQKQPPTVFRIVKTSSETIWKERERIRREIDEHIKWIENLPTGTTYGEQEFTNFILDKQQGDKYFGRHEAREARDKYKKSILKRRVAAISEKKNNANTKRSETRDEAQRRIQREMKKHFDRTESKYEGIVHDLRQKATFECRQSSKNGDNFESATEKQKTNDMVFKFETEQQARERIRREIDEQLRWLELSPTGNLPGGEPEHGSFNRRRQFMDFLRKKRREEKYFGEDEALEAMAQFTRSVLKRYNAAIVAKKRSIKNETQGEAQERALREIEEHFKGLNVIEPEAS